MKRVLVVEDNEVNRYLIKYILRQKGHEVIEAVTGEEGVVQASIEKPDLILMDIQLPGIDGLEATRWIRAAETGVKVPIVALTAHAMMGDRERAIGAGCNGYIEKPIKPESFMTEVEEWLGSGSRQAAGGMVR